MIFRETPLRGAYLIEPELIEDNRGFFARTWCHREFAERGLCDQFTQCNISFNHKAGTVRGMHYQAPPHAEAKLVRCTAGAIYDVIVDMRPGSPTYCQWFAAELSAENRHMLYIPEEFAHGFQTLADQSEVFYQMSHEFHPSSSRGFRWNDPKINISWPGSATVIAAKDASWPPL